MSDLKYSSEIESDLARYRDSTNLVIASQLFDDPARRDAFTTLYSLMRMIDDTVDAVFERTVTFEERQSIAASLKNWESLILSAYSGHPHPDLARKLSEILRHYAIPQVLWENFFRAMWMDFNGTVFETIDRFEQYCDGASVAATTIYLLLIGAPDSVSGENHTDRFDYSSAGRYLGIWAYSVHILRDLREDVLTGDTGRYLIPDEILHRYELSRAQLRESAASGKVSSSLLNMVREFWLLGQHHGKLGMRMVDTLAETLPLSRQKVLCIIISIYSHMSEAIYRLGWDVIRNDLRQAVSDREDLIQRILTASTWSQLRQFWVSDSIVL